MILEAIDMGHGSMNAGTVPPRGRPMPLWGKLILVGGTGCGVMVLACILLVFYGLYWVMAPGKQVPTTSIDGKGSEAVFFFDNNEKDSGVTALLGRLFLEAQKVQNDAQRRQLPESMRWLVDMSESRNRQGLQGLWMYIPKEVTVVVDEIPGDWRRNTIVAVNPAMFTNVVRVALWAPMSMDPKTRTLKHRGREYWLSEDGSAMAFMGGTILFSQFGELMPHLFDRVDGLKKGKNPAERLKSYWFKEKCWDFYALVDNSRGCLDWLLSGESKAKTAVRAGTVVTEDKEPSGILSIVCSRLEEGRSMEIRQVLMAVDVVSE
jgi:hypothetical protein